MIASMQPKEQYVREMDERLSEWESKLEHVRQKADAEGRESAWLAHALAKRDTLRELIDALRDKDDSQFEAEKPRIAIQAEEFEIALVRAAERFQETSELDLDPTRRKSGPRTDPDTGRSA